MPRYPMRECKLAFTDTETTGLDPLFSEIIQLALVITDLEGNEISEHTWNMHPLHPERMVEEAQKVNGYTKEKWDALGVTDHATALREYSDLTEKCLLVGQGVYFDWSMISAELTRQSIPWKGHYHIIDTASMVWPTFLRDPTIDSVSLHNICNHFGISNESAHDAMVDVKRTLAVYKRIVGKGRP